MALSWVIQQQQAVDDLHPANAEELTNIAQETGAEVLRGALRYPSESGGWQLGDMDLSEHLDRYRDREVVLVIGSVGKADKEKVTCGVCGFALAQAGECPRCKMVVEETAKDIEAKQQMREALFREVEEILGHGSAESDQCDARKPLSFGQGRRAARRDLLRGVLNDGETLCGIQVCYYRNLWK